MKKIIIVGAGPAGMMAAIAAADKYKVVLIERNEKLGKKLYITGKGRCNLTNSKDISEFFDYIPGNAHFLYSALYTFTNTNTMDFFEGLGVSLKVERGDRVFPVSNKSSDIINALRRELEKKKVTILLNTRVTSVNIEDGIATSVSTDKGHVISGDHFIVCTGGLSYPQTGSTGDGYEFAREAGHNIVKTKASLVPIEIKDEWIKDLQGLSLKNVELTLFQDNKIIYSEFGEMIFTHYGISGPIVLSGSRFVKENKNISIKASINLKPALTAEELDRRIQRDFLKFNNKAFKNSLNELLPQKLIETIIILSNIDGEKKVNSVTKQERKDLVNLMQNLSMSVKGLRPIAEAIVTSGGIDVNKIDPSTLKSKLVNNLSFAGEVIDIDAFTGGFNMQIALSTGHLAGKNIEDEY